MAETVRGIPGFEVRPRRWSHIEVLFDDGVYSVIHGVYEEQNGDKLHKIGERWNGSTGIGFPSQGGNPIWHVAPRFLVGAVLQGILDELAAHPDKQKGEPDVAPGTEARVRTERVRSLQLMCFADSQD